MENEIVAKKDFHSYFSLDNSLVKLPKNYDLLEYKIFGVIISQLQKQYYENPNNIKNGRMIFSSDALFGLFERKVKKNKSRLLVSTRKLMQDGIIERINSNGDFDISVLFTRVSVNDTNVIVELNPRFLPHLLDLSKNFTKFSLPITMKFNKTTSYVLYLNCKSYLGAKDKIEYIFSAKSLKDVLGVSKEAYVYNGHFARTDFEKYCIKDPLLEICEKSDINIICEKLKKEKGGSIGYKFKISKKKNYYNIIGDKIESKMKDLFGNEIDETKKPTGEKGKYNVIVGIRNLMTDKKYSERIISEFLDYLMVIYETKHPFTLTTAKASLESLDVLKDLGMSDDSLSEAITYSRGKGYMAIYEQRGWFDREMARSKNNSIKNSDISEKDLTEGSKWDI